MYEILCPSLFNVLITSSEPVGLSIFKDKSANNGLVFGSRHSLFWHIYITFSTFDLGNLTILDTLKAFDVFKNKQKSV